MVDSLIERLPLAFSGPNVGALPIVSTVVTGPIDKAGVAAAEAYGLRTLRTAYTGPVIKVRRGSDNVEADIGLTALGRLNTTALLAHCGAGDGFVSAWYDQSGNARHLLQATAAAQPKIVSAGAVVTRNGQPSVLFDGTDDYLEGAFAPVYAAGAATWLGGYTLAQANAGAGTKPVWVEQSATDSGSVARYYTGWKDNKALWQARIADGTSDQVALGTALTNDAAMHVSSTVDTGSAVAMRVDGAEVYPSTAYTRAGSGMTVARTRLGRLLTSLFYGGYVSELVVWPSVVGSTGRAAAELEMRGYLGV